MTILNQPASGSQPDQRAPQLPAVRRAFERAIRDGEIIGGAMIVFRNGELLHRHATGLATLAPDRPARMDDIYWIASMTKPITACAVMLLVERGQLGLDDPLDKYLPEFTTTLYSAGGNTSTAFRKITLRNLLTHTSGLPDLPAPPLGTPLSAWVTQSSHQSLLFEPGSRWEYSNAGMNALGRVVETVSGEPFVQFLQKELLDPLGMIDTSFFPNARRLPRVVGSYSLGPGASDWSEVRHEFINGPVDSTLRVVVPAGGLYSTADDVLRFYRMVLDGGQVNGKRLLSTISIREMTRTQTGHLQTGFVPGMSFGLGFAVVKESIDPVDMLSPGTFGHGGAYGTQSWADPRDGLILILMLQRSNFTPHADGAPLRRELLAAAVNDARGTH